ncbi:hypothetical protein F5888DRAFT_1114413 [Russula emetica]|nr:hypothetical protein F5888DRAFT_1114413 [Russula emetica]
MKEGIPSTAGQRSNGEGTYEAESALSLAGVLPRPLLYSLRDIMPLTFAGAELIALSLESVLYGFYVSLFVGCVSVLYSKRRRRGGGNYRLILVSATLFVLITWHLVIDIIRLYIAFHTSETDEGADIYYVRVTSTMSIVKTAVYLVETIVSDLFILYRCYIVWNASIPIIILPILLYIADIGTGIGALYTLSRVGTDIVFDRKQEQITNAFFGCTLGLNAVCTGLIAFRIWRTQKQTRDAKMGSNLIKVSIIVIESGAIYLSALACVVATYATSSLTFNIFLDITSPIIGIVFSLIIVRIGRGISSEETRPSTHSISYSMPSKSSPGNSNGPIVFRTTTTTQFTDTHETETTIKPSETSAGMFKMEFKGDGDSTISV